MTEPCTHTWVSTVTHACKHPNAEHTDSHQCPCGAVQNRDCACGLPSRSMAPDCPNWCTRCGGQIPPCSAPDCPNPVVYTGLCMEHAEDEYGPQYPTMGDLVGPL